MAGVEQQNIPKIAQDIYLKVQDGDFSESEKQEILNRYESETMQVQQETQNNLEELSTFLEIFQESLTLSQDDIIQLQMILSFSKGERDGVFGPASFQKFINYRKETGFSGNIKVLLRTYETEKELFENLSGEEKKSKQPDGGKDGIWGINTFRYILSQKQNIIPGEQNMGDIPLEETHTLEENRDHIPGDQHPDQEREESIEEKTQRFITEANTYPKTLVRQLQEHLQEIPVDGDFGPNSLARLLIVYPEIQSIQEAFVRADIDTDIDDVLVGSEATEKVAQERFRELYGEFIGVLGEKLGLPDGLIDSIVAVETTYGKDLGSGTGSKGLMQLTRSPFEDMRQNSNRVEKYAPLYQDLDLATLLSVQIDGKTVEERMPQNIVEAFKILAHPDTSVADFQTQIQILQNHLKGKGTGHDHEANLLVGAVYLAYQYRRHNEDVYRTARDYNGEANGGNTRYARNVLRKLESYEREEELS